MNKLIKILKITAYSGIIIASIYSIVKGCIEKRKQERKEKMILIAKQLNTDIKNTERKISSKYHDKNQEKYDEMWGENKSCPLE